MVLTRKIITALALFCAGLVLRSDTASAVDPTVRLERRALFTTTYTDGDECPDEDAACDADVTCLACKASHNDAFVDCVALMSSDTCDEYEEALCCAAEGCTDNEAYADLIGCINEDLNCGVYDVTECDDSSAPSTTTVGGAMTTAGAFLLAALGALSLARL